MLKRKGETEKGLWTCCISFRHNWWGVPHPYLSLKLFSEKQNGWVGRRGGLGVCRSLPQLSALYIYNLGSLLRVWVMKVLLAHGKCGAFSGQKWTAVYNTTSEAT